MDHEPELSKSRAIRDYMTENPSAKPRHVAAALAARGIDVTPAFVSAVNSEARRLEYRRRVRAQLAMLQKPATARPAPRAPAAKPKARRSPGAGARKISLDQLIAAKRFADRMGGIARARAALDALEKITS